MGKFLLALISVLLWATSACADDSVPAGADRDQLAIVGVTVLPMTDGVDALTGQTVLIAGGRIVAVGPASKVPVPADAQRIDGRGRYLLPGLADMHVHLEYLEDPDMLKLFAGQGVTSVRSMDGRPFILEWREGVESGELVGPRIITAGPILDGSPPARDDNMAIAEPEVGRRAVAEQAEAGYDFIKVYSNLSPDVYAAILGEAERRALPVAGHVPRDVPLETAARRHWSIEHLGDLAEPVTDPGSRVPGWARRYLAAPVDPERLRQTAQMLASSPAWIVPTVVESDRGLAPEETVGRWISEEMQAVPAGAVELWLDMMEGRTARMDSDDWTLVEQARRNRRAVLRALHDAGVKMVAGSDTPNLFLVPGLSLHLELANFVEAGMSPMEALRAATVEPARMLGLERDQGTVERGKRADLVLLDADPREDIGNSRSLAGVVLAGRWHGADDLAEFRKALVGPEP